MMKRWLALLLAVLMVFALFACADSTQNDRDDDDEEELEDREDRESRPVEDNSQGGWFDDWFSKPAVTTTVPTTVHVHTFESVWVLDENCHWYPASCGCEIKANLSDHSDMDGNDTCDVCGFMLEHVHRFETGWSFDEEYHWKAASCHPSVTMEKEPHSDSDSNGFCDGCFCAMKPEYTTYTVYVYDEKDNPVEGVYVILCSEDVAYMPVATDEFGRAVFEMPLGNYKARFVEGDGEYIPFPEGETELIIIVP